MLNVANLLSLMRVPLVLVFLQQNVTIRVIGIILAMISDGLDGFLARRYKRTTQFGAFLDPLMDRFFVIFALVIMLSEQKISLQETLTMLCRDFSVVFFGFYLIFKGAWAKYRFRSIYCGKVTTVLQLFVLIALTLNVQIPSYFYVTFIVLGALALVELYFSDPEAKIMMNNE